MPIAPSGQFEYPTEGWSTGRMRKVGDRMAQAAQYPSLSPEEWKNWVEGPVGDYDVSYSKDRRVRPERVDPEGFLITKEHPQLKELQNDYDIYTIPDKDREDFLFLKPRVREPLVS